MDSNRAVRATGRDNRARGGGVMPIKTISVDLVREISTCYPNLALLNLSNNEIREVQNLEKLTALQRLNLSGNRIVALRNMACIGAHLCELHAAKNEIVSADLWGLTRLTLLDLGENRVASLSHLDGLSELPTLAQLILVGNPAAESSTYPSDVLRVATHLTALDGCPLMETLQAVEKRDPVQAEGMRKDPEAEEQSSLLGPAASSSSQCYESQWKAQDSVSERDERAQESVHGAERHRMHCVQREEGKEVIREMKWDVGRVIEHEQYAVLDADRERDSERQRQQKKELDREQRRTKGLEAHLAETMRLLAAERHSVSVHREKERELKDRILQLETDAQVLQARLQESDQQLRALRAYTSSVTLVQADAQAQTEQGVAEQSPMEIKQCASTEGGAQDNLKLLEVQLAATREILALQDRWLVAAGAVSVLHLSKDVLEDKPAEEAVLMSDDEGEEDGACACGHAGLEKEKVTEHILHEWRQQVYILLLQEAARKSEHAREVTALQRTMADLESQVEGVRAELEMARQAGVDLKAQVLMYKNQAQNNESKVLMLEEQQQAAEQQRKDEQCQQQMHIDGLEAERRSVIRVLSSAAEAFAGPISTSNSNTANSNDSAQKHCGIQALVIAEDKLSRQQHRLTFAVKRLAVAKALVQTRCRGDRRNDVAHRLIAGAEEGAKEPNHGTCERCAAFGADATEGQGPRYQSSPTQGQAQISTPAKHREERESLLEEIERLMHERDMLLTRLAEHDQVMGHREAELTDAGEKEVQRLTRECTEVREQLSAALADAAGEAQRVQELEDELAEALSQLQKSCEDLTLAKAAVDAEKMRGVLAVETAVSEVKETAAEEVRALRGELAQLQRENGKQVVQIRQLERQLVATRDKSEKEDRLRLSLLEERLAEAQEALRQLRKERNSLLASLRHLQRVQEAGSVAKKDEFDNCRDSIPGEVQSLVNGGEGDGLVISPVRTYEAMHARHASHSEKSAALAAMETGSSAVTEESVTQGISSRPISNADNSQMIQVGATTVTDSPAASLGLNDTALSAGPTPCVGKYNHELDAEHERYSSAKALACRLKALADGLGSHKDEVEDQRNSSLPDSIGERESGVTRSDSAMALSQLRMGAETSKLDMLAVAAQQLLED